MGLHRLTSITIGVPNAEATRAYYSEWGLQDMGDGWFATADGGQQLRIVDAPYRRLVEIGLGVDDADDLARIESRLRRLDTTTHRQEGALITEEPIAGFRTVVSVAPHINQAETPRPKYNGPGRTDRLHDRADGIGRTERVRPRKLGHVVIGSVDQPATQRFFVDGLGLKVSDSLKDGSAFMRCSTDHHNVLVTPAPVNFLHHTSWQVDDIDDVGRGATEMLQEHPERHVWGLGRHHIGSNFFWYLKDPAGNFTEYYSDLDIITDDELWTPEVFDGARGMFSWGPPPPPSMLAPEDLAALMTGTHAP